MIASFYSSLLRVTVFWYVLGALVLFLGFPEWAESRYQALSILPWVPDLELDGLSTSATVQLTLLWYWTVPVFLAWSVCVVVGIGLVELRYRSAMRERLLGLKPSGKFCGVTIPSYSLGSLPMSTTPALSGRRVVFDTPGVTLPRLARRVAVEGPMREALKALSLAERQLCEELLQLLMTDPEHFAGLGHGVGLLEHTLNVVVEAAGKCTPEFRLPLVAALAHDVGKLITFQPDGSGGWVRKGLHSRESARILATMPAFQELPESHQRGLLLAVKYDHAPSKMPELRGDRDASMLAMRIISALSSADKKATAAEKERNLEKLQPEDLLWKDFVDFLRNAPVVQRGKKGAANQINNPPDSPFLFVYEGQWRDEAVRRLPAEVAAALDLTRRDAGKLAKYTRILAERLRKEGLLVEKHVVTKDGEQQMLSTSEGNPLWDIQSGTGEKAVVMRGILVLHADELWKKVNFRLGVKSPFPVTILAPNANADGRVNQAPQANRDAPSMPDVTDGLKMADVKSSESMAALGLDAGPVDSTQAAPGAGKPKARSRGSFRTPTPDGRNDAELGLAPTKAQPAAPPEQMDPSQEQLMLGAAGASHEQDPAEEAQDPSDSTAAALAFFQVPPEDSEDELSPDAKAAPGQEQDVARPTSAAVTLAEPAARESKEGLAPPAKKTEAPQAGKGAPANPAATKPSPAKSAADAPLTRTEASHGIAIADAAAIAKYPSLSLGEKYYTEASGVVQSGHRKPGAKYTGENKERKLELSESGPRRRIRRPT